MFTFLIISLALLFGGIWLIIKSISEPVKKRNYYSDYGTKNNFGKLINWCSVYHKGGHPSITVEANIDLVVYEKMICIMHRKKMFNIPPKNIEDCSIVTGTRIENTYSIQPKLDYAITYEDLILSYRENNSLIKVYFTSDDSLPRKIITKTHIDRGIVSAINKARLY